MSIENQENISDLLLENQDTKSTETNEILGMLLEKLSDPSAMPDLNLELLNKLAEKLEEIKSELSKPINVTLEII